MQKSLEILSNASRECCRFFCEFRLDARDLRLSDNLLFSLDSRGCSRGQQPRPNVVKTTNKLHERNGVNFLPRVLEAASAIFWNVSNMEPSTNIVVLKGAFRKLHFTRLDLFFRIRSLALGNWMAKLQKSSNFIFWWKHGLLFVCWV